MQEGGLLASLGGLLRVSDPSPLPPRAPRTDDCGPGGRHPLFNPPPEAEINKPPGGLLEVLPGLTTKLPCYSVRFKEGPSFQSCRLSFFPSNFGASYSVQLGSKHIISSAVCTVQLSRLSDGSGLAGSASLPHRPASDLSMALSARLYYIST